MKTIASSCSSSSILLSHLTPLLLLAIWVLIPGCAVGPNYKRPKVEVEKNFGELHKTTRSDPSAQPSKTVDQTSQVAEWWRTFHDPELDALVLRALNKNYNLQMATARLRQARAQRWIVAADLFPEIDADAGYSHARGSKNVVLPFGGGGAGGGSASGSTASKPKTRSSSAGDPPGDPPNSSGSQNGSASRTPQNQLSPLGKGGLPGVTTDLYQVGFDSNWELDVFGGTRRRLEAATADLTAALESRRDVMVTLVSEVARNYIELRGAQQRLTVAQENLKAQTEILELTRSMRKSGLVSDFDVTRAAAQVATTASTIPPLEGGIRRLIHALSTLLAEQPNALSDELAASKPLPALPPEVPVGLPSDLLKRRPDIRRAERQLAAATARIGSAKADLFPKFALTGSIGLDSSSISHLFDWQSRYFLVSPTVTWPAFDAGRIVSNIRLQKANRDESLLQYRNTILSALREVEDALVTYACEQSRRASLDEALNESRRSFEVAREQYEHGLATFLNVLDAQRNIFAAQDALAQSDQTVCTDLVALYKALGGGWQATSEISATETRKP
jgi:NodT family efflux transporter outer membrane factor (OMF) lipoprotein